jgi:hypothetical protein
MSAEEKKPEFVDADGELVTPWTMTLKVPIKGSDEAELAEIKLREPTAGEMTEITKKSGYDADIAGIMTVTGLTEKVVRRLGVRDLNRARAYLVSFIEDGQRTGESA